MNALWESDLRLYVTPPLALTGLALFVIGIRRSFTAIRLPVGVRDKNLRLMTGFRATIVGAALAGIAAGWLWNVPALFAIAAIIGAGELLDECGCVGAAPGGELTVEVANPR